MQELALITPWPPQSSGIADYAFDLALGLAEQDVQVHVFTGTASPQVPGAAIQLHPLTDFPSRKTFDRVVFQMGNSAEHHAAMIPLLAKHRGIVHLHDLVLHHLLAQLTCGQSNRRLYLRAIEHWYGRDARDRIHNWPMCGDGTAHFWDSPSVTDVPFFEPVLQFADRCVVHSQFSRQRLQRAFPQLDCHVIPQVYRNAETARASRSSNSPDRAPLRVGVFGMIQPNKHVEQVLRAVAYATRRGASVHLDIAGSLHGPCETLPKLADELGLAQHVTFHGRTSHDQFLAIMRGTDLHIALRYPTMGECSAVVSRTLQMGIPTIVSNLGWYAELPDFVVKLPTDAERMQCMLNEQLLLHASNLAYRQQTRETATQYATERIDFHDVVSRYRHLLSTSRQNAA